MAPDDPIDELSDAISDGASIDWAREETRDISDGARAEVRSLHDIARIMEFNGELQRTVPAKAAASPSIRWGDFTLLERIGAGANGEVWRAWDPSLHREVAVKFMHGPEGAEEGQRALVEEARALARIRHDGVAGVYGVGEFDGRAGIWMEFVRGLTLAAVIQARGPLPWREVARIGHNLCSALEALGRAGLVHRDIKPANVILESSGRVVLTDFGLGWRRRVIETDVPRKGWGTPLFMAPSLLAGGAPTPRTDLYALGVTLLWALEGRPPSAAQSIEDLKREALHARPRLMPDVNREAPTVLIELLDACVRESDEGIRLSAANVRTQLQVILDGSRSTGTGQEAPLSARPSIAVLPFTNRSTDSSDEYFAGGLADEMLTVLSKIRGLRVAARTSSFQFNGKNDDLAIIGERLRVSAILEGSVRRTGNRVRISTRLVKVPEGDLLWSEVYDRDLEDIFATQDDIARCVVTELRKALLGTNVADGDVKAEVATATRGRGRNAEAHRLHLRARYHLDRVTPGDTTIAIECLEQAVALDPAFAFAWATLGRAYTATADYGWSAVEEATRQARVAIERALALDPGLAYGHGLLAWLQMHYDRDWVGAEASLQRAIELDPNDPVVLRRSGVLAICLDRPNEAISFYSRAAEQDPLSTATYNNLGYCLHVAGRYLQAEDALRKSLDLAPGRIGARYQLAMVLSAQGRAEEALAEGLLEPQEVYRLTALAILHFRGGREAESREMLIRLAENFSDDGAIQVAEVHAQRGELDAAFEWLERAFHQNDGGLAGIKTTPNLRPLAADPRWPRILLRVGFEA